MSPVTVIEPSESTSRTLLERVRRQEPEAWRRFAALYGPIVYRWIGQSRLSHEDALDLTQEVFLSASQHLHSFQRETAGQSLRGWLWTVTRNKVRDHLRRARNHPPAVGGSALHDQLAELPELDDSDSNSARAIAIELSHRAMQLIQTDFEPSTWQAFWATTVQRRPTADVASELGLSIAAVYKAKSRVFQRLRNELAGLVD